MADLALLFLQDCKGLPFPSGEKGRCLLGWESGQKKARENERRRSLEESAADGSAASTRKAAKGLSAGSQEAPGSNLAAVATSSLNGALFLSASSLAGSAFPFVACLSTARSTVSNKWGNGDGDDDNNTQLVRLDCFLI